MKITYPGVSGGFLNVVLGGPWYGSKVDARLLQSCTQFAVGCAQWRVSVTNVMFQDGMLDLARNRLLAEVIASGADYLISVDADCSFKGQTEAICKSLWRHKRSEVAIVGAPVKQGNGAWNVLGLDEQRLSVPPADAAEVGSIGFGWVAFRCGWYASNWPRQDGHFVPFFQTITYPDPRAKWGMGGWGEDFGHCKAVRDKGAKVICDASIRVPHHVARPGHPMAKDE